MQYESKQTPTFVQKFSLMLLTESLRPILPLCCPPNVSAGGGSDDGLSLTEEILIGVAVTLASGLITAVVKKMFF